MNIKIDFTQLVLFSPGIILIDKLKVANEIRDTLSGILDGDPIILPLPDDAPPEFPVLQMSSKDKKYNLNITKRRLDFSFRYNEGKNIYPFQELLEKSLKIFQYIKEKIHAQITRTAIVTQWIIKLENISTPEYLLSKYIRNEVPIINPQALEVHYLTKESISGFEINKWTRIRSTQELSAPEQKNLIGLFIDLNTLAEINYDFNKESLQRFLEEGIQVIKKTFLKHLELIGA